MDASKNLYITKLDKPHRSDPTLLSSSSSSCSLYQNPILGKFQGRDRNTISAYPQQKFHDELLPSYLLDYVNGVQQYEMVYELQHSTTALPFHQMSPECKHHLDAMRDSLAFQLYFVMSDCLLLVAAIIVITYSSASFFHEMVSP